jgi:penicillin amidase
MRALQNENANLPAQELIPVLEAHINSSSFNNEQLKYLNQLIRWNRRNDPDEEGATIFKLLLDSLQVAVWKDEFARAPKPVEFPEDYTLIEALKRDTLFPFIDDINTPEKEDLTTLVTRSFLKLVPQLSKLESEGKLPWSKYKDSGVRHLLRLEALSNFHLRTGGGRHIINASKQYNGPSWKMVVHLTDEVEAYGIYPGGQSGNPGSRFYDQFVNNWAAGNHYRLWFMKPTEATDKKVRYLLNFSKA